MGHGEGSRVPDWREGDVRAAFLILRHTEAQPLMCENYSMEAPTKPIRAREEVHSTPPEGSTLSNGLAQRLGF